MGIDYSLVNYTKKEILRFVNSRQPYKSTRDSGLVCLYLLENQTDEIRMFELPDRSSDIYKTYFKEFKDITNKHLKRWNECVIGKQVYPIPENFSYILRRSRIERVKL